MNRRASPAGIVFCLGILVLLGAFYLFTYLQFKVDRPAKGSYAAWLQIERPTVRVHRRTTDNFSMVTAYVSIAAILTLVGLRSAANTYRKGPRWH